MKRCSNCAHFFHAFLILDSLGNSYRTALPRVTYAATIGRDSESGGSVTWFSILVTSFFHADPEHCLCKQKKLRMGDIKLRIELCHGIKLKQKSLNFYMLKKKKKTTLCPSFPTPTPIISFGITAAMILYASVSP